MVKPIAAFSKDKRDKKYGVRHSCKECNSKNAREIRAKKKAEKRQVNGDVGV
jgi:ribosomal protein L44E